MNTMCPHCERPTLFIPRTATNPNRRRPPGTPRSLVSAVTADGCCTKCWRDTKGKPRPSIKGLLEGIKYPVIGRGPLTDEQIERAREDIERFWTQRRARGVDPEGEDPAQLYRHGRTLLEA